MVVLQIHAQTIGDYRSKISGNWNVAATWETWNGTSWIVSGTPSSANQNITIQNGHIVTITANVTIDQTTVLAGGKVILAAGTLTIANGTGTDFIIAGVYERISTSTTIVINTGASISCSNGGLYTHKVAGGSIPSITWDNGSVLRLDSSAQSNLNQSFWNVEITGGNASTLSTDNTSRTITIRNDFKLQGGNFYLKNGGLTGGTHVVRIQGQFIQTGGSFNWNSSSSDNTSVLKIEVEKDLIISGGTWAGFVSSTDCNSGVYFLGTGEQTYSTILEHNATGAVRNRFYYKTSGGPTALNEIYNGTNPQFTINGTCGTIVGFSPWPTSGSLLQTFTIINSNGITLRDNRTINDTLYRTQGSITLSSSTITYASNAALAYNGTLATNTENAEFPLSNGPKHLIINNNSGVTLHSDRTIAGNLHFQNGLLNTGSCVSATNNTMLVLASGSSVTGANNTRYVNGILRKIGNTAFTFPIGNNGQYAPIGISAPTSISDHFTACYINTNPDIPYTRASKVASIHHVSSCEYWHLNRTNGSSNVNVTLSWANRSCGVGDLSTLRVCRWNGTQWENEGNTLTSGDTSSGTIRSATVVSFSPFTLGSTNAINMLPVELIDFSVVHKNNNQLIQWTTASEINNHFFSVEKSQDAIDWTNIANIKGAGTKSQSSYYEFLDFESCSPICYYRLKQTDFNGIYTYSNIIAIQSQSLNDIQTTYSLNNENLIISSSKQIVSVQSHNLLFQEIKNQPNILLNSAILNTATWNSGMYYMSILYTDNTKETIRFFK